MNQRAIFVLFFFVLSGTLFAQRSVTDISSNWQFSFPGEDFQQINIPHTYNANDPFDDEPGYYRGKANYRKIFDTRSWDTLKKHFVKFYAVNQHAKVFLNGKMIGEHKGGYTAFVIDLSQQLTFTSDTLVVEVDNSHDEAIVPLKGDFNFYGGIYRKVEHIAVSRTHIDVDVFGANGFFIDPVLISDSIAKIRVRLHVVNFDSLTQQINLVVWEPNRREGDLMYMVEGFDFDPVDEIWYTEIEIKQPALWSTETPKLLLFTVDISDPIDYYKKYDELNEWYGFRDINFDPDNGFFLNGNYEKLIGVNRHQDRPGIGNALTAAHHIQDMDIIREMGANFLRTAHYPQDKVITDYCDRNGILVSMEIPLDHEISDHPEFIANTKQMMLEMIHQYYNHPSVIIWAYMNEMGLGKNIKRDSLHMTKVADLARELEDLTRKTDPYRYTMIPNHGYLDVYREFGLTDIPMIVGWNLYHGWYVSDVSTFGEFVDKAHELVPDKPMIITEYGAGADPRITSFYPKRFDFSLNWALHFHRSHLKQIMERDFIAGSAVWNMFDFGSEARNDAVPHINNKGLCGFDRKPKSAFYLYQNHMRPDLEVEVKEEVPEYIFSDEKKIQVLLNGYEGGAYRLNEYFNKYSILSINFGTDFYFDDGNVWIPDSEVPEYIMKVSGGNRAEIRNIGYGTAHPIAGTDLDPVYQTWYENPKELSLRLPMGKYQILVHLSNNYPNSEQEFVIEIKSPGFDKKELITQALSPFKARVLNATIDTHREIKLEFLRSEVDSNTFLNGLQIIRL